MRRYKVRGLCLVPTEVEFVVSARSKQHAEEVAVKSDWRKHIGTNAGDESSAFDFLPSEVMEFKKPKP